MSDQEDSGNSPDPLAVERSGIWGKGSLCGGALHFAVNRGEGRAAGTDDEGWNRDKRALYRGRWFSPRVAEILKVRGAREGKTSHSAGSNRMMRDKVALASARFYVRRPTGRFRMTIVIWQF